MAFTRTLAVGHCLPIALVTLATVSASVRADDFDGHLKTLFAEKCVRCHGGKEVNGKVNLQQVASERQLLGKPELISDIIGVVDSNDMPPEGEPQISKPDRARLLTILRRMLRTAARAQGDRKPGAIRRLNRLQYNNTLKDLFGLKRDVFPVPEKLMTRAGDYLVSKSGKMPDRVTVASHSLAPKAGLRDVRAFPKDLRASHGFDNQANQLTLSPLLLDAFLRLSVSIVESPDFTRENVGMWDDFFAEPSGDADRELVIRQRLDRFLHRAFRGLADDVTRDRYAAYVTAKLKQGVPFTDCMKKAASAALSSPLFLYRSTTVNDQNRQFELASRLSYFLWNSCPDDELLRLAKRGELARPVTLNRTIDRMLADRKISRFLDAFPSQWMQLENLLAVTPDPKKSRYFQLDRKYPASLQMVLEPLLLFDAVFVEDRRLIELISPTFGFQSEFLKTWYTSDLTPPRVDVRRIVEEGRVNDIRRRKLQGSIKQTETERDELLQSVRSKLLAARKKDPEAAKPVDLKPYAAWEFNGDLKESVRSLELQARGKVEFHDGMVVLNRSFLISKPLPIDLKAKSRRSWSVQVPGLDEDWQIGAIVGPSGCGKSTTLRMIAGLEEITDGEIHIDDRLVNDVPPKDRDIAMVFQNYALYPHMTVYENMAFGLKLRKYPKAEIEERVNEAAGILSIGHLLSRKPKALSGGERQRVAVGRAIVRKPKVFLFDEPLSNLDATLRVQMRTEISKLHNSLDATMIYVTHDQVEAMTMGDRIAVMKDGELLQVSDPIHLYENPINKFVAGFIGSPGMNFMEGRIVAHEGKLVFNEGHLLLIIPEEMQEVMAAFQDQEVTFGIRPEDVAAEGTVKDWSTVQAITATVEVVEPMGSETFLYLTTGKHPFIAKVDAHVELKINAEVPLIVNMARAHFFRKDDETTIV